MQLFYQLLTLAAALTASNLDGDQADVAGGPSCNVDLSDTEVGGEEALVETAASGQKLEDWAKPPQDRQPLGSETEYRCCANKKTIKVTDSCGRGKQFFWYVNSVGKTLPKTMGATKAKKKKIAAGGATPELLTTRNSFGGGPLFFAAVCCDTKLAKTAFAMARMVHNTGLKMKAIGKILWQGKNQTAEESGAANNMELASECTALGRAKKHKYQLVPLASLVKSYASDDMEKISKDPEAPKDDDDWEDDE